MDPNDCSSTLKSTSIRSSEPGPQWFPLRSLEKAEALKANTRLFNGCRGGGSRLHLAHFPTQHIVHGGHVARKIDPADIGSLARVDEELHHHGAVIFIDLWHARDCGEVVALIAQAPCQIVFGRRNQLLGIDLLWLHNQEAVQILLGQHQVATQTDLADSELLPFSDVGGDVDLLLVGRDRHLSGIDM